MHVTRRVPARGRHPSGYCRTLSERLHSSDHEAPGRTAMGAKLTRQNRRVKHYGRASIDGVWLRITGNLAVGSLATEAD